MSREEILQIASDGYTGNKDFDIKTFKKDVHRFFTIRKMVKRFLNQGVVSDKLLLNNIIVCLNIFGIHTVNTIVRGICSMDEMSVVITFLKFLDCYVAEFEDPESHPIISDILDDITHRYNLSPHQE